MSKKGSLEIHLNEELLQALDYRSFLKSLLALLKNRNSAFSLRGLAQKIEVQPSFLSDVINGKKKLSVKKTLQICAKLNFPDPYNSFFYYLVLLERTESQSQRENIETELKKIRTRRPKNPLSLNTFAVFSKWECVAIFELLSVAPQSSAEQLASLLGISTLQARDGLSKLTAARMIEEIPTGYKRLKSNLFIDSAHHNMALKIFHESMLQKSQQALFEQGPEIRYTGTETMMVDSDLIPQAHQLFNQCLDQIFSLLSQSEKKNKLMHIHLNMFELTKRSMESV